ncbi:alpha/beta hydrolase family protein [Nonomuraea sp. NPDC050227]|uniref:alpha/beta hydrolase family protein n=1 Tax=Nonomuraea sp. NPDC050227 TaxID=3364360 RepID=UPI0037A14A11
MRRTRKTLGLLALACAGLVLATATAPAALALSTPQVEQGSLVSAKKIKSLSATEIAAYLRESKFPVPPKAQGADLYAVVYRTVGVDGSPTTASGTVAVPHKSRKDLWTVSYEHGTTATRAYVGSMDEGDGRAVPMMFAAAGFIAVAPDYLGLGTAPGFHPYMDHASEASATVDLLRAARSLATGQGRRLSGDVLVTGFSQGGTATMAVGRQLQAGPGLGFRLRGLAPISGPYEVQHVQFPELIAERLDPRTSAFYLAYWTASMNRLHHFYDSPAEAFQDPAVEALYDGNHTFDEIIAGLPASPLDVLTPKFQQWYLNPSGAVLKALETNDDTCSSWRPRVPVRLFAARGDREVVARNSRNCLRDLRRHGTDATLTDVGDIGHMDSPLAAMPTVLRWFTDLR